MNACFDEPQRAVAALVQALDRADAASGGQMLGGVAAEEVYRAAVAVLMRLVVLAWADRYGPPLPASAACHARRLFQRAPEDTTPGSWELALAAFDAMHGATGNALFDGTRFPFLRTHRHGALAASPVDDHMALLLCDAAARYVAGCSAPGDAPAVAALGALYEAMLAHTAARASEPLLALQATGRRAVVAPLRALEAAHAAGADALATHVAGATGRTARALRRALEAGPPSIPENLCAACGDDDALYRRVGPFALLLASETEGRPAVVGTGRLYVAPSNARRAHGAHYTPDDVAAEIVAAALEPLVYADEGQLGTARQIHPAARLLALKVCDPAMGVGAFLLAACRYLADRVVESWALYGAPSLPRDPQARRALARRLVATRCLYGVDLDSLAVDLARIALSFCAGAVSLPHLEHALRHGDALLGIAPGEEQGLCNGAASWDRRLPAGNGRDVPAGSRRSQRRRPVHVRMNDPGCTFIPGERSAPAWLKADAIIAARLADGRERRRLATATAAAREQEVAALLAGRQPFHWPLAFPEVFQPRGPDRQRGFDAVIGNPPFGNAVERATARDAAFNRLAAQCYDPFSRGANDYCLLFWARALLHLLAPHGTYGLLGPTALLSDLKPWQGWVHAQARPTTLIAYPVDRFPAARVRVTGYCGRRGAALHVRVVDHGGEPRHEAVVAWTGTAGCWHEATAPTPLPLSRATCRLADLPLSLHAGCAAGVAYELAPLVVDDEHGSGPWLVTTGAIGRYCCTWGQRPIRYLKGDYRFPRWPDGPDAPAGIARARERQRGPKILLGGLTSVLEAVFDPGGELAGVVSTWVIGLGAATSMDAASTLLAILNSATFSRIYATRYGGKAMNGRQMTIQKAALMQMPCPLGVADALRAPAADMAAHPGLATTPQQLATCHAAGRLLQTLSPRDPSWLRLDKAAHLAAGLLYGHDVAGALDDYAWWCHQTRTRPDPTSVDALVALLATLPASGNI